MTFRHEQGRGLFGRIGIDVGENDSRTVSAEAPGDRDAYAARTARYYGNPPVKPAVGQRGGRAVAGFMLAVVQPIEQLSAG
jgi:hypothetical protein